MKKGIHPPYNETITVTCSCGNTFVTGSIRNSISVEICNKCHPFYTGEQRFVDTKGTVERFKQKQKVAQQYQQQQPAKKKRGKQKEERGIKSLRELMASM